MSKRQSQKQSSGPKKGKKVRQPQKDAFDPMLKFSSEWREFRESGDTLAKLLKPIGLSVSKAGELIAKYQSDAERYKAVVPCIPLDILKAYAGYLTARQSWESLRDSFRSAGSSRTVQLAEVQQLLGQGEIEEEKEENEEPSESS